MTTLALTPVQTSRMFVGLIVLGTLGAVVQLVFDKLVSSLHIPQTRAL